MISHRIQVVDSHTGGEPTRVVVAGGPNLGSGPIAARRDLLRERHDEFRRAVLCEPRGSDVLVGALLLPPVDPRAAAAVVYFNNVGYLGMCGHGTIGVGVTLGHLGRIAAGRHLLETPVGTVPFDYDGRNTVALDNVPSYRWKKSVTVAVDGLGEVTGDIAYGGNWFFLVERHGESLELRNVARLTAATEAIRAALRRAGVTGADGAEIDHVELFGPPADSANHSRNFVLCPGGAYDRSPCGTGTSAKLACLAADGKLPPGREWRQESIVGSVFVGSYRRDVESSVSGTKVADPTADGRIVPTVSGTAYVTTEATLIVDDADPFAWGIR